MNARIKTQIQNAAVAWESEFGNDTLDGEWTGTAYADLPAADQKQIDWSDFHDAIKAVLDGPVITLKVYEITAEDSQNEGQQHSWEIYELPTGEALDPGDIHADQWYDDVNSVEAYGLDFVVGVKDTGRTTEFSEKQIRESVNVSAKSYGPDAIPESLQHYLDKD